MELMSNDQNTILDEDKREYLDEHPLKELFDIVGNMLGRPATEAELKILHNFLLKTSINVVEGCKKTALRAIK